MKRIAFVIGLLTFTGAAIQAQQAYYMFILADNQQPFYVRLGEKTYPSSGIGHLVIPRLKDSSYSLAVGFPRKAYPEQIFVVTPNGKDLDYQLRHNAQDGWNLVNGQTAQTIKARQEEVVKTNTGLGEKKTGGFAVLMSGIVNDSTVMYKTVAKVNTPPAAAVAAAPTPEQTIAAPATVTPVTATQTDGGNATAVVTTPPATPVTMATTGDSVKAAAPDSAATASAVPRSVILDVQEWWNEKGKGYIYYDSTLIGVDTISILVEYGPPKMINPNQAVDGPAKPDSTQLARKEDSATQQPVVAATDSTRKQAEATLAAGNTEKIAPPVVPAPDTAATASVSKPVEEKQQTVPATISKPVEDKPTTAPATIPPATDSVKTAVTVTPSQATFDSAKLAQATAAGNAKVDSVKAITEPVNKPVEVAAAPTETPKKEAAKAIEPSTTNTAAADAAKNDSLKAASETKKQLLMMNSDCINFATESDVDKLRVKMLNTTDVDDRITAAKKIFKTKCFVTRYIRGLSELFPNEEARFKFFDAAYPYVSDSGRFRTLVDLFTEDLWIARFKALVRM
ncbi:DUF4476 domain-containing protein [Paraflavitalea pollutisoli]|uniref:DUF4476 domain-containing protein n=1 Tax=Paraflavitalea pollutisoli TaxID=3034143 RepID=UPI0023EB7CD4|nr:DUF4476 domain-containing protein [Paraflavitalea sp. H1-2-19X]